MANLTITAANVVPDSGASKESGTAGTAITAGAVVYLDNSTTPPTYKLCDSNDSTSVNARGIALNGGASGQPISVMTDGTVTIGASVTNGNIYILSATAGGLIADVGDLASGWYPVIIGIATSSTKLKLSFFQTGIAK